MLSRIANKSKFLHNIECKIRRIRAVGTCEVSLSGKCFKSEVLCEHILVLRKT